MTFVPCLGVSDTGASIAYYEKLGFQVDSSSANQDDDIHMLLYKGNLCCMLYSHAQLQNWLPCLAEHPIGFAGMFYLPVGDIEEVYNRISTVAKVVKPLVSDNNGQRMFYIQDLDGYVIGFNDQAALEASDLGKKYAD